MRQTLRQLINSSRQAMGSSIRSGDLAVAIRGGSGARAPCFGP